jgi:cytosine/adenosine deaminase-related metal-dependent hydrolase
VAEAFADEPVTYAARWVVPIETPPIENGCVVVQGERITAFGSRRLAEGRVVDLGEVVLLPGLVNVHTHLEFSQLRQPLGRPNMPFADWIREVIAYRRRDEFDARAAVARGLAESAACGVTTLGEIASAEPFAWFEMQRERTDAVGVVAFIELLGLSELRAETQQARLHDFSRYADTPTTRRGISPHAPYTVRPSLFEAAIDRAREHRLPLAFHLAESRDELQLLRDQTGPLVDLLRELGAWDDTIEWKYRRPLDYLQALSRAPRSLVIHGNYLDDEEIGFLAAHAERMTLVYCPRTHAYFGHDPHPLAKVLAAGGAVALGTDGRSSNPDLNLWEELRHVQCAFPHLAPEQVVRMGTLAGAQALGLDREVGSIVVGKHANLVVVQVDASSDDPYSAVLAPTSHVARVVLHGSTFPGAAIDQDVQ